jgi:hypothetical protein
MFLNHLHKFFICKRPKQVTGRFLDMWTMAEGTISE